MEIKDKGLPIHEDAELKIRPRIFLEGNFFVDIEPGSPSRRELEDGGPIPVDPDGRAGAVRRPARRAPDRHARGPPDLPEEYSKGLEEAGAEGFNQSLRYWEPAYRNTAIANDATLGQDPTRDLQRVLRASSRRSRALVEDEDALKDLVTNFNITAARLRARGRGAGGLVPALRDTLRVGSPALGVAQLGAALAARVRGRGAAGRALLGRTLEPRCRSSARRACCVRAGAARDRARPAAHDPRPRGASTGRCAVPRAGARALVLHQRRARAVHRTPIPNPERTRRKHGPAVRAAPARLRRASRREPPLRRQQPVLPRQRRRPPGTACARRRRPTAATSRRRTGPTCRARRRSRRT